MSRAKTAEEVREDFLQNIKSICRYWANAEGKNDLEKCEGVAFSILNIFDGTSSAFPTMDIILRPHPEDKQYHIDNGMDYYEDGQMINDCYLHSLFNRIDS